MSARIDALRGIVQDRQARVVEGVLVDATTASAILQVYDRLNAEHQAKMRSLPMGAMADLTWQIIGKARETHGE